MRDTVGVLLVWALFLTGILTLWLSGDYAYRVRKLEDLTRRQPDLQNLNMAAQSLANEALEYSRKNPAIDPILFEFGLKAQPGPGTNQPPTKQR